MTLEERMKIVLDDFEVRLKKLETPPQKEDAAKQAEDTFIQLMKEINADSQTDQPGAEEMDDENFLNEMKSINQEK